jgi:hypothetical protein
MASTASEVHLQQDALAACVRALRGVASFRLDSALDRRLQDLGERKEFLSPEEHSELLALVALAQQRTRERLEAQLALEQLLSAFPDLAGAA